MRNSEWIRVKTQMYSIKIIFKNEVENGPVIFEESVLMVKAASFDEAYDKAEKYTREWLETDSDYVNMYGLNVHRSVVCYADCFEIIEEENCTEVYSSYKMNRSSLSLEDYIGVLTNSCSAEELKNLRHC